MPFTSTYIIRLHYATLFQIIYAIFIIFFTVLHPTEKYFERKKGRKSRKKTVLPYFNTENTSFYILLKRENVNTDMFELHKFTLNHTYVPSESLVFSVYTPPI